MAINSLRADFIILDCLGYPVVLIEYNGYGHNIENPAYRDIRKQYACQQVNLPLVIFYFKDDKNAAIEENNRKLEEVSRILLSHTVRK
ncbi:adenylosuccinate synthetase [Aggregatibacter actinomycetemcomitans]|nr:adenylosuccinate synthetase [Aggregatibacter actinomycetemcomitans ANH9381]AMQ92970.1 adenylosuccinate synthetase [Aggregatibacter actinomycetemcomitans]KOE51794.1 adenylosuccinate synthetase [Aggregatibacter actinomycetemcomitans serotype b str. I23C]KOE54790.1 adenylosuccinate synthetase [Aggregatibacter actinomycetemcomitans serotype b str. S23A]